MKKLTLLVLGLILIIPLTIRAGWIDEIKTQGEKALEPVIGDIGAALSGGITGRTDTLGILGAEAAIVVSAAGISADSEIIPQFKDIGAIPLPWLAGEIGLPMNISLFLRGVPTIKIEGSDINLIGGGVRYAILEDKLLSPLPGVSAVIGWNALSSQGVKIHTTSLGIAAGKKFLFITPYVNLSYNFTRSSIETGTPLGTLEPKKDSLRIGGGVEITPFPFVFINAGINSIDANIGWDIGLGIRFKSPV